MWAQSELSAGETREEEDQTTRRITSSRGGSHLHEDCLGTCASRLFSKPNPHVRTPKVNLGRCCLISLFVPCLSVNTWNNSPSLLSLLSV